MYSIVRTYERDELGNERPVLVRIHSGCTDGLENYWADWNHKNPGKRRRDGVMKSEIISMSAALEAIRRYC